MLSLPAGLLIQSHALVVKVSVAAFPLKLFFYMHLVEYRESTTFLVKIE